MIITTSMTSNSVKPLSLLRNLIIFYFLLKSDAAYGKFITTFQSSKELVKSTELSTCFFSTPPSTAIDNAGTSGDGR
jgi:hypothetical protein